MKKNLLRAAAAIAGLIIGIVIFFPWDALAPALFAFAAREAASRGVYVTASSSETSGLVKKNFSYKGVNADLPVARARLSEVSVEPDILSSLLSGEKSARLTFGRGSIVRVEAIAGDHKVVVAFDDYGEKTLLAKFAKLRKLQ